MNIEVTSGKDFPIHDQRSIEALYNQHAPRLLSLCMRYCGKLEDAEDVLHDGFIKIIKSIGKFRQRSDGSLEGWMKRIMVNTALNYIRDHSKERMFVNIEPVSEKIEEDTEEPWVERLAGKIETETVLNILCELPSGYRTIFNLYAIESYSHKEIAALLKISENTSKSQLSKARAMLRKKINERFVKQGVNYE